MTYRITVTLPSTANVSAALPRTVNGTLRAVGSNSASAVLPSQTLTATVSVSPGVPGPAGPPGPPGPPGGDLVAEPGMPGDYVVWGDAGQLSSQPMSTMMVSGSTIGKVSLDTFTDAGSFLMPDGILASEVPPGGDPDQQFVLAVTSSPATEDMSGINPTVPTVVQAGVQILTMLTDPSKVWRRSFNLDPPVFGQWVLSGQGAGLVGTYRYIQDIPAATWTIIHNLGFRPNVSVVDSAGTEVIGEVSYPDVNTVVIDFSAQFAGEAYLS